MSDKHSKDVPLRVRLRGAGVPGIPPTCALEVVAMDTGSFELALGFWSYRPVSELAAEQGITSLQRIDLLTGAAADLFEDDEDVERFVADIYTRRREGRER